MENFKDVTFIIPVRFDSEDRRRNFKICIDYLLNNFDTNIIVLESDTENIIQDVDNNNDTNKKNKNFSFWELLNNNDG